MLLVHSCLPACNSVAYRRMFGCRFLSARTGAISTPSRAAVGHYTGSAVDFERCQGCEDPGAASGCCPGVKSLPGMISMFVSVVNE